MVTKISGEKAKAKKKNPTATKTFKPFRQEQEAADNTSVVLRDKVDKVERLFFSLPRKISRILSIIKDIDSSNLAHSEVSQSKNKAIPGRKIEKKLFN